MKKSFIEKIQEWMSSMGGRFLVGMAVVAVGALLSLLGPLVIIGIPLALAGAFTAISVCPMEKAFYADAYPKGLHTEDTDSFCVIKIKYYAYPPVIFFCGPFFYVPYRTRYFVIKNSLRPDLQPGSRISMLFMAHPITNYIEISKAEFTALEKSGQMPACVADSRDYEKQFYEDAARFIDAGFVKPVYRSKQFSVCEMSGDCYGLFTYSRSGEAQCGIMLGKNSADMVMGDPHMWLNVLVHVRNAETFRRNVVVLDDKCFAKMQKMSSPADKAEPVENKRTESTVDILRNTAEITKQQVINELTSKYCSSKKASGIFMIVLSVFTFELGIAGIATLVIPMGILFLAVGAALVYYGVKKLKTIKGNRSKVEGERFRLVKTYCKDMEPTTDEHDTQDGWKVTFENGACKLYGMNMPGMPVIDDKVYLLYLEGEKDFCQCYCGTVWTPAEELNGFISNE